MGRARILVVDDEAGMLRSVERVLAPQHDVRALRLPSEALEAVRHAPFDLAVLDLRMPGMDGFDLMAALKVVQPDLDVILMTGSVQDADARLIRAIRERAFFYLTKPFDRDVLLALVSRCLDLRRATQENRAYLNELELQLRAAQRFQESLLPRSPARAAGFEVLSRYQPWAQLGGDFYDVTSQGPERAVILILDVSGHGAAAAMLTGMVKLAFREAVAEGEPPAGVMRRIAASCRLFPDGRHLTALCARLDATRGELEYVNAGHPPGVVVGESGALARLEPTGILIHPALSGWSADAACRPLGPRDRVFLYTDGVIECRAASDGDGHPGDEQFGVERLEETLAAAGPDEDLIERVGERLTAFRAGRPLEDDAAMMLVRRLR